MNEKSLSRLFGIGAAVLIAAFSHLVSFGISALDPLVLSMLISIIVGNLIGPRSILAPGIEFSRRVFIPIGIILYGSQMDLGYAASAGLGRLLLVVAMTTIGIYAIYHMALWVGIPRKTGLLLAAGTAVCGASAIMVLSPVINAEKEETSISLLSITVIGLIGIIVYPITQELLSLSETTYAFLCGSTLPQVGQVKAAASMIGEPAIAIALPVKLIRVGLLLPLGIIYSLISDRSAGIRTIPWFMGGFIIIAVVANTFPLLNTYRNITAPIATFLFSIAICGIGLSVDIESIVDTGLKPIAVSFMGWLCLIALFAIGTHII